MCVPHLVPHHLAVPHCVCVYMYVCVRACVCTCVCVFLCLTHVYLTSCLTFLYLICVAKLAPYFLLVCAQKCAWIVCALPCASSCCASFSVRGWPCAWLVCGSCGEICIWRSARDSSTCSHTEVLITQVLAPKMCTQSASHTMYQNMYTNSETYHVPKCVHNQRVIPCTKYVHKQWDIPSTKMCTQSASHTTYQKCTTSETYTI